MVLKEQVEVNLCQNMKENKLTATQHGAMKAAIQTPMLSKQPSKPWSHVPPILITNLHLKPRHQTLRC